MERVAVLCNVPLVLGEQEDQRFKRDALLQERNGSVECWNECYSQASQCDLELT